MTSTFTILVALTLWMQPERYDTVVLSSGGVLRGTVVENVPGADLVLLMPDGTTRKIPRAEVVRVDWASPAAQPAPPPPGMPPPPPLYPGQPPPPPPYPGQPPPFAPRERGPLELGMWISGAFPVGTLYSGFSLSSAFTAQFVLGLEASWRVTDPLELGVYLRFGGGSTYSTLNNTCLAYGGWCDAFDFGVGFFPRWSFAPRAKLNPWLQIGVGYEYLSAFNDWAGVEYGGWELGAWGGLDFNTGPAGSLGLFAGGRWGEFTAGGSYGGLPPLWGGNASHGWIDVGFRWAWWP